MNKRLISIAAIGGVAIIAAGAFMSFNKPKTAAAPRAKTLIEAADMGDLAQVQGFLKAGAKVDERGPREQTPLIVSLFQVHPEVALELIKAGADVKVVDARGFTPLHYAAANDEMTVVPVLVEKGADINAVGKEGYTPLNLARFYTAKNAIAYLTQKGAKEMKPKPRQGRPGSRLSKGPG